MRNASSFPESTDYDSVNTLLYSREDSGRGGPAVTDLVQRHSDVARTLVVTVGRSVEDWLSTHLDDTLREELVIVSVGEGARSTAAVQPGTTTAPAPGPVPGEPVIEFVPDARNLTALGQTINTYLTGEADYATGGSRTVLYLDSISALLETSDVETVFRFLHMLTSLVKARGATAYYRLETSDVDSETISILSALFDAELDTQVLNEEQ